MRKYLPLIAIILVGLGIVGIVWAVTRSSSSPKTGSQYYTDKQTGRQFFNDPNQNQENASYPNFMSLTGGENLFNNVTSAQYEQIRSKLEFYLQTTVDADIRTAHISNFRPGTGTDVLFDVVTATPEVTVHVQAKSVDYYNIFLIISK